MSYKLNIESKTLDNNYYRNVLYTNKNMQLVLMNLLPYQEIGMEKHNGSQFIRVESGSGVAIVKNKRYYLKDGSAIIIDANTNHNIIAGKNGMKLYSIYTPPQHNPNIKQKDK
jgi:mannose-6-phosphate isomerase-like protein (cupin superfamily)